MDRKKLYIYGGVGAVVLIGGYFLLHRQSAAASSSDGGSTDALGSYNYPIVYGAGSGSVGGSDTTGTGSSDDMIGQLLAQQLATATMDTDIKTKTLESNERVSMATLASGENIAKLNANASIEQSLASQLGAIAGSFGMQFASGAKRGPDAVFGTLGYDNGKITVDLAASIPGVNKAAMIGPSKGLPITVPGLHFDTPNITSPALVSQPH